MPRLSARPEQFVQAITADEVAALWRDATKIGPYPDQQTNEQIAKVMNDYMANPERPKPDPALLEAVDTLLRLCKDAWGPQSRDFGIMGRQSSFLELEDALNKARPIIQIEQEVRISGSDKYKTAAMIFYTHTCNALEALNRYAGTTKDSVAVIFTCLALHRMGFPQMGPSGFAATILIAKGLQNN